MCTRVRVWIRACNVHRKNVGVHICRYRCRCRRSVITDESLNMQRHPRARDLSRNSFLTDLWNAPVRASVKEHCKFVCTHTCVCGIELAEKDPRFVCTSISFFYRILWCETIPLSIRFLWTALRKRLLFFSLLLLDLRIVLSVINQKTSTSRNNQYFIGNSEYAKTCAFQWCWKYQLIFEA